MADPDLHMRTSGAGVGYIKGEQPSGLNKDIMELEEAVEDAIQAFGDITSSLEWVLGPPSDMKNDNSAMSAEEVRSPFSERIRRETYRIENLTSRIREKQSQLDLG
jgi:hypothetical protein